MLMRSPYGHFFMAFDDIANFGLGVIQTPPSPASSGTSFTLTSGQGTNFPTVVNGYNVVVWPNPQTLPSLANAEIVRVTAKSGDVFTITRQQESTNARAILQGDYVALVPTKKVFTDMQSLIPSLPLSIANGGTGATSAAQALTNLGAPTSDGWVSTAATLTYTSTDGHTFVVGTSIDLTGVIQVGDKIKFTNNATTFYGFVTAISSSSITLYGGTNYTVANSAITNPFYSHAKSPFGFVIDPTIWTEQTTSTGNVNQASPTASTWYNLGPLSLVIPIGKWNVSYQVIGRTTVTAATNANIYATLSTANNSQSDRDFTAFINNAGASGNITACSSFTKGKPLTLASKTTYFLNAQTDVTGANTLEFRGDIGTTFINAICAYL